MTTTKLAGAGLTLALALALGLTACSDTITDPNPSLTPPTLACSAAGVAASEAAVAADPAASTVCLLTSQGEFVVALDPTAAPLTVANFLRYVGEGFYDLTVFHRVMPYFVIQGGGFNYSYALKPTHAPIVLESDNGLSNVRGTLAMARTDEPTSATSQFFVNVIDNSAQLDFIATSGTQVGRDGYTVFGHVISGMETVDKIDALPTYQGTASNNQPYPMVLLYWAQQLR